MKKAILATALGGALLAPQLQAMPLIRTVGTETIAYEGTRAPEFPAGLTWLNTSKPLSIKGLRGKMVLLDFWTYGCINCLHVIPDLKKLEAKYGNQLVVISVHSAKFDTESEPKNVRNAALRYGIEHPVLVDQNRRVWSEYAVRAWPTLVLIDPNGKIVRTLAGEGHYNTLDNLIGTLSAEFKKRGELSETPLPLALERAKVAKTPLYFPGKIAAKNGRLVVADSSHNRLVVSDQAGKIEAIIGNGKAGLRDGSFQNAQFFNPQGLWIEGDRIYVADTNNHAIRRVDLKSKTVETLAGTGKQAPWKSGGGKAAESPLSSPWDVLKRGDELFIAMAGPHQIWKLDLKGQTVGVWAGTGAEARVDGPRLSANFAQPSGLATDGKSLFVADSESSCIRAINFETGRVKTLAGGNLFDFGDINGPGAKARFRHPLGLAFHKGALYVADTYNGKVRRVNVQTGAVTWALGREKIFNEIGGLAFDGDKIFLADTNNHQVLATQTDQLVKNTPWFEKVEFGGLKSPQLATTSREIKAIGNAQSVVLAPNSRVNLVLDVQMPAGFHLYDQAPQKFEAKISGAGIKVSTPKIEGKNLKLPIKVELQTGASGRGKLDIEALISYCNTGATNGVCKQERIQRSVDFQISTAPGSAQEIKLSAILP